MRLRARSSSDRRPDTHSDGILVGVKAEAASRGNVVVTPDSQGCLSFRGYGRKLGMDKWRWAIELQHVAAICG